MTVQNYMIDTSYFYCQNIIAPNDNTMYLTQTTELQFNFFLCEKTTTENPHFKQEVE